MNVHVLGSIELAGAFGSLSIETTCPEDPFTLTVTPEYCGCRPSSHTARNALLDDLANRTRISIAKSEIPQSIVISNIASAI
jgi:hypothetical protein